VTLALSLLAATTVWQAPSPADLNRHLYPLAKPLAAPTVTYDVSEIPEAKQWAEAAKKVVQDWYPTVTSLLATEGYKPGKRVHIVIKKEISAPAWASGDTITVSAKWITEHPDDLGMMVHELTHIIQSYPRNESNVGWLVEGIADYVRWWRYEPEAPRPRIDPEKSKYTDAYRTTAYWLAWVSRKYDMRLVPALDRELRKGKDPNPVFLKVTGKKPDELWKEFIASLPR
jgi:hypothetical protein